jgi:hypothetical protein
MRHHRCAGVAAAGAGLFIAACGSSSTSSSAGSAGVAVQAAFANYGNQSSAHVKIVATGGSNPGSFDLDVTKDGAVGSGTFGGQTLTIIYASGHGYAQLSAGGPYTQLPDDIAKPFKLFTISTFASCFNTLAGSGSVAKFDQLVSGSATTLNGTAGVDYKAVDGTGDIVISTGSNPLPLKLTTTGSGSSSSASTSSSVNAACDLGSSSSSSGSSGGTTEITWTYPGKAQTITPPPTTGSST